MTDPESPRPHLVPDPGPGPEPEGAASEPEGEGRTGRGGAFWLLAVLAVLAVAGFAFQTQRVQHLQSANAALASELFSARTALDAYTERFSDVRDTVAALNVQIEALNALVREEPATPDAPPAAAERP